LSGSNAEMKKVLKTIPLSLLLSEIERRMEELKSRIPEQNEEREKIYSVKEVSELCLVKISTVQRWVRDKKYPAKKIGRSYFFSSATYAQIKQENGFLKL